MNGVEPVSFEVLPQNEKSMDFSDYSFLDINEIPNSAQSSLSSMEREDVEKKLTELLQDNISMKEALEVNNTMMREQLTTISAWHTQMTTSMSRQQLSLQEATDQIATLKDENKKLSLQMQVLEEDKKLMEESLLASTTQSLGSPDDFEIITCKDSENVQKLRQQLADMESKLEEKTKEEVLKANTHELEVAALKEKVTDGDKKLALLSEHFEEEKKKHENTMKNLNAAQCNYDRVNRLLQIQSFENETRENVSLDLDLQERKHQEEIDDLTARLLDLEQKLEEKDELSKSQLGELTRLKADLTELQSIREQMNLYQAEAIEKNLNDSEVPQNNEGAAAASSAVKSDSRHHRGRRNSRSQKETSVWRQENELIICPICDFGFTDLLAAENHVNLCIDNPNS